MIHKQRIATAVCVLASVCIMAQDKAHAQDPQPITGHTDTRTTAAPVWNALGPEGGYFVDFLFSHENPNWILAGGDDSIGIWKSTDGGDSWRLVSKEWRNVTAWEFERDPETPTTIYTVDIYGRYPLLKSIDDGETWMRKDVGITQPRTHSIAVVPKAPGGSVVLVGTMVGWEDSGDAPAPDNGGIFKSTDGGDTWSQIEFRATAVKYLEATPDGTTVYAGTAKGLYRSSDGGAAWEKVSSGLPEGEVSGLEILPSGDIYAAVPNNPGDALYVSKDGGATWKGLGLKGEGIWDIIIDPDTEGKTIYVGTLSSGPFKTTDGGATWRRMTSGIYSSIVICLAQDRKKNLLCSTYANEGILRSTNGGESWHRASKGLTPLCASTVRFDPNDASRLLVTALGPYSFNQAAQAPTLWEGKVDRAGAVSWKRWDHLVQQVYAASVPIGEPDKLLLGTFGKGVLFSKDGGKTFESVLDTGVCSETVFDPGNPKVAMASVLNLLTGYTPAGTLIMRTDDGGETWQKVDVEFLTEVFIAERDSDRVWAAAEGGLRLSEDNGATWAVKGLKGETVTAIAQHPDRPAVLYAADKRQKLYRTADAGETWKPIEHPGWPQSADIRAMLVDAKEPDRVYVGLNAAEIHNTRTGADPLRGGLWMSPDGGVTWKDVSGTMSCDHVRGLGQSPDGKWLYVATYSGGLLQASVDSIK